MDRKQAKKILMFYKVLDYLLQFAIAPLLCIIMLFIFDGEHLFSPFVALWIIYIVWGFEFNFKRTHKISSFYYQKNIRKSIKYIKLPHVIVTLLAVILSILWRKVF